MENIFVFGKTVSGDAFTDREEETNRLIYNFRYGINTFIVSPRRWGKTSLVMRAKSLVDSAEVRVVYVDIQQCRTKEDFCIRYASAVIQQTSSRVEEWLDNAKNFLSRFRFSVNASADPATEYSFRMDISPKEQSLEDILQLSEHIAKKKKCRVVVCIDEFQQIGTFADSDVFQSLLRTVWQHHQYSCYCLFGSKKHMMEAFFNDVSRPFYKFGDIIYLQRIPTAYWVKYIQQKFSDEGKKITKPQASRIVEVVDGNSSYIQQLSWYVFINSKQNVTKSVIDMSVEQLIDQCAEVFEAKTENLTNYQMQLLIAIADGVGTGLSSADVIEKYRLGSSANVSALKKLLLERDYIMSEDKRVVLSDPVMGLWIRRVYCAVK